MAYHICFSNPIVWDISYKRGVYGNVGTGNDRLQTFWGKLIDLLAIKKGDLVFFYVKEDMYLTGVYEVSSKPYYCENELFKDATEKYPFRFNFKEILHFENSLPVNELAKLIENNLLNSISTFERDRSAGFRGIRQITNEEGDMIRDLFFKYNPKTNINRLKKITNPRINKSMEAIDIADKVENKEILNKPVYIKFNKIPVKKEKGIYFASYENILQGYIFYCIRHNRNNVIGELKLNNFTQCLMEVRLLKAQQFRSDILLLYQINGRPPHFFSIIETKKNKTIVIEHLSQLIGYMKTYASSKNIPFNSLEGIYISTNFEPTTSEYLKYRKSVEKENPIRLINYTATSRGTVKFAEINI